MAPEQRGKNLLCSLLLSCGDVLENPGTVKNLCGLCDKPIKRNQKAIECEECFKCMVSCQMHVHYYCKVAYEIFGNDSKFVWICNICAFPNFSTTFLLNNILDITDDNSFASLHSNHSPIGSSLQYMPPALLNNRLQPK